MKQEFINHLSSYLSQQEIDSLIASFNQKSVNGLILNKDKMDEKTLLSLFPNIKKHPIVPYAYIFDKDEYQLGKTIYSLTYSLTQDFIPSLMLHLGAGQ